MRQHLMPRRTPWHTTYNEGYLAACKAGSYLVGATTHNVPHCPYRNHAQRLVGWLEGVIDCCRDRQAGPVG